MKNVMTHLGYMLTAVFIACVVQGIAQAEETPKQFKDSSIKRRLKNGKLQKFDGNKYKIVPRGVKTKPKIVVKEKFSVEVIGTTNESIMIGGGFSF